MAKEGLPEHRNAIDPAFVAALQARLQDQISAWAANMSGDWHATHEESGRSVELTSTNPQLPILTAREVRLRGGGEGSLDLGTELRFSFKKTVGGEIFGMTNVNVTEKGAYRNIDFKYLFVSPVDDPLSSKFATNNYYEAMEKIGFLELLQTRLPEDVYGQPGVYGLEILNTILQEYVGTNEA